MTTETKTTVNDLWEVTRTGMETMLWGQDQAEALLQSGLKQAHTLRHEGHKVILALLDQAKVNQEEFNRKTEENLRSAMQMVPGMGLFLNNR